MPRRDGVLLTRPEADSMRIAGLVASRGYVPVVAPLLQVRRLYPDLPRDVQAVLVTSANGLDPHTSWPVRVLAVGDATAACARASGFADVVSAKGDGNALVALAVAELQPEAGPVLLLSGLGQGDAVAAGLRQSGFRVVRRVTYAAEPVAAFPPEAAAALAAGTLHAAIFLSGETAAAFVRLLPASTIHNLQGVLGLAIGKAAADALELLPWREIRLAHTPNLDNVLALL